MNSSDSTADLLQRDFSMPRGSKNGIYSFDRFKLDSEKLMLYRDEVEITLPPKIVKTLAVLIENRGSILSKDELIEKVWDDSIVEESNLSQNLYILRKTLGAKPDGGQYIETLRRRGYRFNAEVTSDSRNGTLIQSDALLSRVPLIGREKEIDEVIALLSSDGVDLITVSGVGGVGKTALARAVAEKSKAEREVFFVELAPITRPEFVVSAIASALGVKDPGNELLIDRINETLDGRSVLLVLDNFEQIVSAASLLEDLANSNKGCLKILVTSRVTLRIKAETLFVLPPLQIPEVDGSAVLLELSKCEAVSLFLERAKQAQSDFELTSSNARDVASICAQLGGLPLAIELAAARMRFMSPETVLKRLQKQLDFLQSVKRDAPQRQRTMRETIAWSYDLLADQEKRMFARLSVFSGGFDIGAAEFICSELSGESPVTVLEVITSLVEHNLLAARTAKNGEPRIQMLEVVREFAGEVLAERDENETTRSAHAEYFARLGEEAEPQLLAARSAVWLDRLETEHDNLRAALSWSEVNDPSIGQRLAGAVWRFWWLHGHIREACKELGTFLGIADTSPNIRAKMLVGATFLNRLAGNSERSRIYAEEGVKLASSTGDLRTGALSLNQLGFLALDVGDFSKAESMFRKGLKQAAELGDIQILALLNNGLGELCRSRGDYAQAVEFYRQALEYNREAGDRVRQTTCLINLGATALMQNDRESAGAFYRDGLEISSVMEDMNGTLYCLEGIAGSFWAMHDPERACLIFGAADTGRRTNNLFLEPADQVPYEQSIALVRESIGIGSFDLNFAKGNEIGLQAAISLALDKAAVERKPAAAMSTVSPDSNVLNEHFVVERHGNVLRLVDWAAPERAPDAAIPVPDTATPKTGSRPLYSMAIVLIVLTASIGSALYLYNLSASSASNEGQNDLTVTRLTNMNYVRDATISRDGNYFAYNEALVDSSRVWLQQVGKSARVEIVPGGKWQICCKTFSPDGKYLYFAASKLGEKQIDLYRVTTLGGPPEKIIDDFRGYASFSPDGTEVLHLRVNSSSNERSIVINSIYGSSPERQIFKSDENLIGAAWSPDAKTVVLQTMVKAYETSAVCMLSTLDLATNEVKPLSDERWGTCFRMEWLRDGSGFAMVGTRDGETNSSKRDQVYFVSYPGGNSRRLTTEGSRHEGDSLGVTDDGTILAVPFNRSSQIWSMDANGDARSAVQLTLGAADGRGSIVSLPDGRIGYTARSGDELNMWLMNSDGSNQTQIGSASAVQDIAVSPDGRYFVYSDEIERRTFLFRIGTDGSEPVQLTKSDERVIDSTVSPDGAWLVYDVWATQGANHRTLLKKVPFMGGESIDFRSDDCSVPHFSPDGSYVSCVYFADSRVAVLSIKDGSRFAVFNTVSTPLLNSGAHWTPDSRALVYIVHQNSVCNLWKQPIDGGKPEPLTNFTSGSCYSLEFSKDGSRLLVARGEELRDAVLIKHY